MSLAYEHCSLFSLRARCENTKIFNPCAPSRRCTSKCLNWRPRICLLLSRPLPRSSHRTPRLQSLLTAPSWMPIRCGVLGSVVVYWWWKRGVWCRPFILDNCDHTPDMYTCKCTCTHNTREDTTVPAGHIRWTEDQHHCSQRFYLRGGSKGARMCMRMLRGARSGFGVRGQGSGCEVMRACARMRTLVRGARSGFGVLEQLRCHGCGAKGCRRDIGFV